MKFSHNFENDILAASRNMAKRYKCHTSHNQVLEQYALGIFDSMKKIHGLSPRERLLLECAVYLHDCGKFISLVNSAVPLQRIHVPAAGGETISGQEKWRGR